MVFWAGSTPCGAVVFWAGGTPGAARPRAGETAPLSRVPAALAAMSALVSGFPMVRLVSPNDMVGFTEQAKVTALQKAFEDAYKSPAAVLVLDDIERLLGYVSIGPTFSNFVLQNLLVLLKRRPPKVRFSLELPFCLDLRFTLELHFALDMRFALELPFSLDLRFCCASSAFPAPLFILTAQTCRVMPVKGHAPI